MKRWWGQFALPPFPPPTTHHPTMQTTFDDKQGNPQDDEQRRLDNAARANKGEAQVGGSAGRQQVADKNPAGEQALGACEDLRERH